MPGIFYRDQDFMLLLSEPRMFECKETLYFIDDEKSIYYIQVTKNCGSPEFKHIIFAFEIVNKMLQKQQHSDEESKVVCWLVKTSWSLTPEFEFEFEGIALRPIVARLLSQLF